jgi:ribosomal protein S18 acetylase RimI-like enzyme
MKANVLEWDSLFFNKKIGQVEFEKDGDLGDVQRFDLLYVKQTEDEFFEIDHFKQTHAETKVVFSKALSRNNLPIDSFVFLAFDINRSKDQIYQLAFESGKFSRFKLDENFKANEFEELYKTWVDNSFSKKIADAVLIYKEQNVILGFISYKMFGDYAIVGLIAVCPEHQRKGVGKKLVAAVENELSNKLIKELRIPTQLKNEQACGFYAKLGYKIIEQISIKHYWKI